jgi:hypothetical protein
VPELEDELRIARRKAVLVRDAAPQDERVVVEPEVGGIEEENLANLERFIGEAPGQDLDAALLGRTAHDSSEGEEALPGCEAVWLQNELALEIMDVVERKAVDRRSRATSQDLSRRDPFGKDRGWRSGGLRA